MNLPVRTWSQQVDLCYYLCRVSFNTRPARCHQHNNRQGATRNVLLIAQILIGGDEHLVTGEFDFAQKLTIVQLAPTQFVDGGDLVPSEQGSKWHWRALIEQDPHLRDFQ